MAESAEPPVSIDSVSHYFGYGALRKQILFEITESVRAGEIVILTGPSGSGKTTLLTLIGALRSAQEGSLTVLGQELRGASQGALQEVRKKVGYIFQAHNLLDALSATQNVQMALIREQNLSRAEARKRATSTLEAVGLGDRLDHYPSQLSGGQKQRVAIARALAGRPRLILADEPTASLDKKSGRDVVDLMHDLAKREGCAVVLVTHDNRILDIADRIIHLEDGRLAPYAEAVAQGASRLLESLAQTNRQGDLVQRVRGMTTAEFAETLEGVTGETRHILELIGLANDAAFESMLEQVIEAFTIKIGDVLRAERASLFLVDRERGELWSKVAQSDGGAAIEIRIPITTGIAGHVARTGQPMNVPDAYAEPLFNRDVDRDTGYRTHTILCEPIVDTSRQPFAVVQLLNKEGGAPFDRADESRFAEFAGRMGPVLEAWWRMGSRRRRGLEDPGSAATRAPGAS